MKQTKPYRLLPIARKPESWSPCYHDRTIPVGSYHVPFCGYPILGLGTYNHKVGYLQNGHGMSLRKLHHKVGYLQKGML